MQRTRITEKSKDIECFCKSVFKKDPLLLYSISNGVKCLFVLKVKYNTLIEEGTLTLIILFYIYILRLFIIS